MFLVFLRHGSVAALLAGVAVAGLAFCFGWIEPRPALILLGALLFYASEYGMHRFAFHAPPLSWPPARKLQHRLHYDHHVEPSRLDLLFLPIWFLVPGQRENEIANLRRSWINERDQLITLPDWICKNNKEHVFPYGDLVADILAEIPRRNSTDLLFPCRISDDRPISGWSKFKKQLDDGVPGWTLHDLRRTYRSIHGQIGTPREIAERLINHAAAIQTDVEEIYDRWHYIPQMRSAVATFEEHFMSLIKKGNEAIQQCFDWA